MGLLKEEKEYLDKLATLGCYCCRTEGIESPAMIHHIREGMGMGQRAPHIGGTIPLCYAHHQSGENGALAFHRSPKEWRERYGSEKEIAEGYRALIDKLDLNSPHWNG
jgi:hypothetical protein